MKFVSLVLFLGALITIQALIGGARQVFALPGNVALAVSGLMLVTVRREPAPLRYACLLLAGLLVAWVVGRAACSPVNYLARNDAFMVVAALIAYLAVVVYYPDPKSRLIIVAVLIVCALAHAAVGAVQFKENNDFMLLPGIMRPSYEWRASGFYICPNHLAGLFEMVGLMGLSVVCWGKCPRWVRVVVGYCVLMCLAGQALTGSRGGYLSIVFGMGVFAALSLWIVHRLRTGQTWVVFAALLVGGGLIVGGTLFLMQRSDSIANRLAAIYDPQNIRPLLWRAALAQYQLEPLTGTGSGTYTYYGRQFRSPLVQNDPIHVHDDYLELLAEYGLIGAALCGAFVLMHLYAGLSGIKRIVDENLRLMRESTSNELALTVGAFSGVAALLLHSIVDFNLHVPANTLVISIFFGILATPTIAVRGPSPGLEARRGAWLRWPVLVLSAALLLLASRLLPGEVLAERARVALREDRNSDALALAERGLSWEKKNPNLYGYLAEAKHFLTLQAPDLASQQALHTESVEAYEKSLELFPRDTGTLLKLGETLDLMGRFAEADDAYARAFECDPNFGNVYAYYGRHCVMLRRFKAAERYFRRSIELNPWPIAVEGLQSIERMKQDPAGRTLMSLRREPDDDTPAPPHVLGP